MTVFFTNNSAILTVYKGCGDDICVDAIWNADKLPTTSPPASTVITGKMSPALKSQICNLQHVMKNIEHVYNREPLSITGHQNKTAVDTSRHEYRYVTDENTL